MDSIRKIFIALFAFLGVNSAIAQSVEDIYRISFKNRATGTARSAAMGGAFTSLGADGISMTLNPAGLGMYRSSEITFTPSLFTTTVNSFSQPDNSSLGALKTTEKNTGFTMSNFTSIFNIFSGRDNKSVRSFTIGVGYSKDSYTNYKSQSISDNSVGSIGDYFGYQLYGVNENSIKTNENDQFGVYRRSSPDLWGAIMAYSTYLVDPIEGDIPSYAINQSVLDASIDQVIPSQKITRKTMIDNFNVSAGINIGDMLYLKILFF